jgi:cytochrome c553
MIENMHAQKAETNPQEIEKISTRLITPAILHRLFALALLICNAGWMPDSAYAAAAAQADAADDLRAAYATPQDISDGKKLAQASCAGCHGISGIATAKDFPNIAGQRPGYLYRELRVYQAGGRGNTPMNNVVKFLSDDALIKVAAYYASLDPALPAPMPKTKAGATAPSPLNAGKAAAAGCAGCHGEGGISKTPGMPSLAGLDPKYLVTAMSAYKGGQRKNDMMKALVSALSETDMNNIALFYATQKPGKSQTPAAGSEAAGKSAAAACAGCHGEGGVSTSTAPSLAGQDAQYFAAAIHAYKDGSRTDPMMKAPATSTDDASVKNLAAYYANQPPQAPKVRLPVTTEELAQRCDRCHGVNGNSTDPRAPALASQRAEYLEKVLRAYQKGERKSTAMTAMLEGLNDADIDALAAYYSRRKARSVVYVPLPAK